LSSARSATRAWHADEAVETLFVNSRRHSSRVAERALARVRALDPGPGERLLDLGCGNGAAALTLAKELGLRVVGVDLDAHQIDLAQQSADGTDAAQFLLASATAVPFPARSFELVFTNKTTLAVFTKPE
jgi:ubiquinone/menaquinone biosynthesis C-methylase UbiE